MVDIYQVAKRRFKYLPLATDADVSSCFSVYYTEIIQLKNIVLSYLFPNFCNTLGRKGYITIVGDLDKVVWIKLRKKMAYNEQLYQSMLKEATSFFLASHSLNFVVVYHTIDNTLTYFW